MWIKTRDGDIYDVYQTNETTYTVLFGHYGSKKDIFKNSVVKKSQCIGDLLDYISCQNKFIDYSDFEEFEGKDIFGLTWLDNELLKAAVFDWDNRDWKLL